jgi:hypothetical protein
MGAPEKNHDSKKIGPELSNYIKAFADFKDEAAPAPEVEIKVKGLAKEFYQKYLSGDEYILKDMGHDSIRMNCKPRFLLRLLKLDELEYMDKVPGIYEPM